MLTHLVHWQILRHGHKCQPRKGLRTLAPFLGHLACTQNFQWTTQTSFIFLTNPKPQPLGLSKRKHLKMGGAQKGFRWSPFCPTPKPPRASSVAMTRLCSLAKCSFLAFHFGRFSYSPQFFRRVHFFICALLSWAALAGQPTPWVVGRAFPAGLTCFKCFFKCSSVLLRVFSFFRCSSPRFY